jgi:uncharacterized protein YjiS (DUF1127 family)
MDSTTAVPSPVGIAHDERPATERLIIDGIVRIAMRFMAAVERSQQRRALAALSDHVLYDIGLTRDDFARRTSRWQPGE